MRVGFPPVPLPDMFIPLGPSAALRFDPLLSRCEPHTEAVGENFSQPGHPDLILAEFQAKMRAGEFQRGLDPAEDRAKRGAALLIRWAILISVAVLTILNFNDTLITVAVIAFLVLAAGAEVWLWRRRSRAEAGELID